MSKYKENDLVRIIREDGIMNEHGKRAIIEEVNNGYSIYIEGSGGAAWFFDSELELIEHNRGDLLIEWQKEAEERKERESNIDWIFANGTEVIKTHPVDSLQTLAHYLGNDNLWGEFGEAMTLFINSKVVMDVAKPFLLTGDKEGYLNHAQKLMLEHEERGNDKGLENQVNEKKV
jgi:hypothetical protein